MGTSKNFVTIVSGLPRSGTSMMMRMLEAGGISPVVDGERKANADNPMGYYEFEPVKALKEDSSWVADSTGHAVKVIYKLVYDLPNNVPYRIVFMQRDIEEVLSSQEKMMRRDGLDPDTIGRDLLYNLFQTDVMDFRRWAEVQGNIQIMYADYRRMVDEPEEMSRHIAEFLDQDLDIQAMASVVDPDLYRNRA
ncbi:sulfotransferase family protein [Rhodovulum sp. FJ3]|uniref:sulfotransferase family protein n=1 Tax=Rhodovulum sp. FJ3 TaxID=3079053 RepID=UPI00293DF8E7|nr:sulfotransferase family protein [Rhodovulum sp. FJ3]MDV4166497.1 sulfotransferase family protein [Rhodovulum sp. FJ3]